MPYHTKDTKRDHNFDNHPCKQTWLALKIIQERLSSRRERSSANAGSQAEIPAKAARASEDWVAV